MSTHPNLCKTNDSLLVIVDIQTKLADAMPEADAEEVINNSRRLVEAAGILKIPVLLTEQYPKGLGPTDTSIAKNLPEQTQVFEKTGFSCCAADGFCQTLEASKRQQVILVGQEAHVCILQTALELLHQGYQVYVVEDAVCSRNAEHKFFTMNRMQHLGITITNHESVLFEWLQGAEHADFKTIAALLY